MTIKVTIIKQTNNNTSQIKTSGSQASKRLLYQAISALSKPPQLKNYTPFKARTVFVNAAWVDIPEALQRRSYWVRL